MPRHPGAGASRHPGHALALIPGHSRPGSTVSDAILTVCLQPSRGPAARVAAGPESVPSSALPGHTGTCIDVRDSHAFLGEPYIRAVLAARLWLQASPQVHRVHGLRPDPQGLRHQEVPAVPPDQWIWSPEVTHAPLTGLATWQAAQKTGGERGNVRDSEKPTSQPGSRYMLRSRIRHQACQRRMYGTRRPWRGGAKRGGLGGRVAGGGLD
jgi:hypothetical protein